MNEGRPGGRSLGKRRLVRIRLTALSKGINPDGCELRQQRPLVLQFRNFPPKARSIA